MQIVRTLLLSKNCQILVLKTARKLNKKPYSDLPGGKVEENEPIEQAATREIKEETGLIVDEIELNKIATFYYIEKNRVIKEHIFCGVLNKINIGKEIHLNLREHDSCKFCDIDELRNENFHNQILEEIDKRKSMICEIYRKGIKLT